LIVEGPLDDGLMHAGPAQKWRGRRCQSCVPRGGPDVFL